MSPSSLNGGLEAPSPRNVRRPRKRPSKRAIAIAQIRAKAPGIAQNSPAPSPSAVGGGVSASEDGVQAVQQRAMPRQPKRGPEKVGPGGQAGLGPQLTRRVESGAISEGQAKSVASDRALLQKTYGPDWRVKVYGDRGYMQRTREALAKNPQDPSLQALYQQLLKERERMLAEARSKGTEDPAA